MAKPLPPQIVVLALIARSGSGLTLKDVAMLIEQLHRRGLSTGYGVRVGKQGDSAFLRELMLDVNTLKVLGLVKEVNGRLVASEKGLEVLKKVGRGSDVVRYILGEGHGST